MESLDAPALAARLQAEPNLQLVDVREPWEVDTAAIAGTHHIPLAELPQRAAELDPRRPTAVICHHGVRSAMAGQWLERAGFDEIINLSGGIDAWSQHVDAAVPRY
ncbi:rhodanese-like domain-containing protein [Arhodomonas sp. AD133]|uniref:rhodanese-like domain-containing protein n=1 Tax=Arhodomonas sp. AD133 TaxID=3415009 RepID=UPI003EBEB87F